MLGPRSPRVFGSGGDEERDPDQHRNRDEPHDGLDSELLVHRASLPRNAQVGHRYTSLRSIAAPTPDSIHPHPSRRPRYPSPRPDRLPTVHGGGSHPRIFLKAQSSRRPFAVAAAVYGPPQGATVCRLLAATAASTAFAQAPARPSVVRGLPRPSSRSSRPSVGRYDRCPDGLCSSLSSSIGCSRPSTACLKPRSPVGRSWRGPTSTDFAQHAAASRPRTGGRVTARCRPPSPSGPDAISAQPSPGCTPRHRPCCRIRRMATARPGLPGETSRSVAQSVAGFVTVRSRRRAMGTSQVTGAGGRCVCRAPPGTRRPSARAGAARPRRSGAVRRDGHR